MPSIPSIVVKVRDGPSNVDFEDLLKVCEKHFGAPRRRGTSRAVFTTPWAGDHRVNIQDDHGKAKAYQVRQVLRAIDRMGGEGNDQH